MGRVVKRFEGKRLIIEKQPCLCECKIVIFDESGRRCEKCFHRERIPEEDNENWEGVYRDRGGNPIPLTQAWTGKGILVN